MAAPQQVMLAEKISAASGVNLSDDFNRANAGTLGANWTTATGGFGIFSNQAITTSGGFANNVAVYSATAVNTVNQYVKVTISADSSCFRQVVFRYTNSSSPYYIITFNDVDDEVDWAHLTAVNGTETSIQQSALTQSAAAATYGITLTGTGNSTEIRIWVSPSGDIPDSATSWGGDSTPDITLTDNPGSPVDTGNYLGLSGITSTTVYFDNWFAGDIP